MKMIMIMVTMMMVRVGDEKKGPFSWSFTTRGVGGSPKSFLGKTLVMMMLMVMVMVMTVVMIVVVVMMMLGEKNPM